jgi:hypothetical protein
MNDFVAFLIKVDNIYDLQVEVSLKLTPVKSVTISRPNEIVTYSQFPLKHSCPQKKEPRIPSLVIEVNSSARASHVTYFKWGILTAMVGSHVGNWCSGKAPWPNSSGIQLSSRFAKGAQVPKF